MDKRAQSIQSVIRHLRVIFRTIQAHSKYVEKACGLSSAKLWMLHEIYNNPGLKVSQLARALTIHPSTCSNMLDKLERPVENGPADRAPFSLGSGGSSPEKSAGPRPGCSQSCLGRAFRRPSGLFGKRVGRPLAHPQQQGRTCCLDADSQQRLATLI